MGCLLLSVDVVKEKSYATITTYMLSSTGHFALLVRLGFMHSAATDHDWRMPNHIAEQQASIQGQTQVYLYKLETGADGRSNIQGDDSAL